MKMIAITTVTFSIIFILVIIIIISTTQRKKKKDNPKAISSVRSNAINEKYVMIYSKTCGYCTLMMPSWESLKAKGLYKMQKICAEEENHSFQINAYPTILYLKNNTEKKRHVGAVRNVNELERVLHTMRG